MTYDIEFSKQAGKVLTMWKRSNPRLFKKATELLLDISEHPHTGIGHPEPLVEGSDVTYSRRISAKDRIIYNIYDDQVRVIVIQVGEHYNDK